MIIIDAQKQGIFHHIITDGKFGNCQDFYGFCRTINKKKNRAVTYTN